MIYYSNFDVPGGGGFGFVASASNGANSNNYSVDLSGLGIQANDLVVVATGFTGNGIDPAAITCVGDQSGSYSLNTSDSNGSDTWDTCFKLFYKKMGATPDSTLSMTGSAGATYGGATVVHIWRGIDTTSPIDTTGTVANAINTGRGNAPAITPTATGAVIIACGVGAQAPGGSAYTVPTGMQHGVSYYRDASTSGCGVWMASDTWVSGSYDPAAITGGSDSTNASCISQTIALKPA